jgi:DNA-directed RNA polymerase subunit RPC12/RpoP
VSELPVTNAGQEVVCPHCKKKFAGELMAGRAARHQGFKCPHCRLFVPLSRADRQGLAQPQG